MKTGNDQGTYILVPQNQAKQTQSRKAKRRNRPSQGNTFTNDGNGAQPCENGWLYFKRRFAYYKSVGWSGPFTVMLSSFFMILLLAFSKLEIPVVTALIWWFILTVTLNLIQVIYRAHLAYRDWSQRRPSICQVVRNASWGTQVITMMLLLAVLVVPVWYGFSKGYIVDPFAKVTTAFSDHAWSFQVKSEKESVLADSPRAKTMPVTILAKGGEQKQPITAVLKPSPQLKEGWKLTPKGIAFAPVPKGGKVKACTGPHFWGPAKIYTPEGCTPNADQ